MFITSTKSFLVLVLVLAIASLLLACGGGEDTSSPQQPVQEPYAPMTALATLEVRAAGVDYAEGLLALAGPGEVALWDSSNLRSPRKVGAIAGRVFSSATASAQDGFGSISLSGRLIAASVFPACLGFCQIDPGYVGLYDVSKPDNPKQLASIPNAGSRLLIDGNLLYILRRPFSFPTSELQIVDISNPSAPQAIASLSVASAFTFEKRSTRIYLPFSDFLGQLYGIQVVDVTNPRAPSILRTEGTPSADAGGASAALSSTHVFWTNGSQRVGSLDTASLQSNADITLPNVANGIATYADNILLVAAGVQHVQVYAIQPDATLRLVQTMHTPYPAGSVRVFGTTGVVLTEQVLDCSTPPGCSVLAEPKVVLFSTTE